MAGSSKKLRKMTKPDGNHICNGSGTIEELTRLDYFKT